MSQCAYITPQSHPFSTMPFTHVDTAKHISPLKRKPAPLALCHITSPIDCNSSSSSPLRLKPNPYAADQMASIPPRVSPSASTPPSARNNESLPSIRDMIPELPAIGTAPPQSSNQDCGPESFQPSGPVLRPAATGLAPSPLTSTRMSAYPSPESSLNGIPFSDRQYPSSAPSGSRSSTSRNSPIQSLPLRAEPTRALPPLGAGFGSPGSYTAHSGSSLPHSPPPPGPWQGSAVAAGYHPAGPAYGLPAGSPAYTHYEHGSEYGGGEFGPDGKSKRRRGNLPKQVTDTLRKWFNEHIAHPYPTEDEKMMLMGATNLTMSQISNWFINARRRSLPQQQQQQQQQAAAAQQAQAQQQLAIARDPNAAAAPQQQQQQPPADGRDSTMQMGYLGDRV